MMLWIWDSKTISKTWRITHEITNRRKEYNNYYCCPGTKLEEMKCHLNNIVHSIINIGKQSNYFLSIQSFLSDRNVLLRRWGIYEYVVLSRISSQWKMQSNYYNQPLVNWFQHYSQTCCLHVYLPFAVILYTTISFPCFSASLS